jgi:hypothetical protein
MIQYGSLHGSVLALAGAVVATFLLIGSVSNAGIFG